MSTLNSIYAHLPLWAQQTAVSTWGFYWQWLGFGPGYEDYVQGYREREHLNAAGWQAWQQGQLRQLLSQAARYVPYYRETWSARERAAAEVGRLADLPLLAKEAVRADPLAFARADLQPRPRFVFRTSGS